MSASDTRPPAPAGNRYKLAWIWLRAGLSIWAGFWIWFAISAHLSEHLIGIRDVVRFVAAILVPVIISALKPRIGGGLLALLGLISCARFNLPLLWGLLAAPAIVFGILLMVMPRLPRPR